MDYALEGAKQAASQLFDDVEKITFLDELPTGEKRFKVSRSGCKDLIIVSVNPNHINASIEWKRSRKGSRTDYHVCKIQDLVIP